jgi:hypothetical protein
LWIQAVTNQLVDFYNYNAKALPKNYENSEVFQTKKQKNLQKPCNNI